VAQNSGHFHELGAKRAADLKEDGRRMLSR